MKGIGQGPGLSRSLATLGQICVRLGNLERADAVLHRALDVRCAVQFHETTGAVYDTLAQMSLMRGDYENAAEYLRRAAEAFGAYGRNTSRWYEWSLRVDHRAPRDPARRARRRAGDRRRDRALARGAAGGDDRGRAHRDRSAALRRSHRRGGASAGAGREPPRSAHDARRVGRVPAAARRARAPASLAHDRGVPRHRAELERVRAGRRALSGRRQPAGARAAGGNAGAKSTSDRHYHYAAQVFQALGAHPRPGGRARGDGRHADDGHGRVRRLPRRCRRRAGASDWWTPPCCPICWRGSWRRPCSKPSAPISTVVFVQLPGGDVRVIAYAADRHATAPGASRAWRRTGAALWTRGARRSKHVGP